jgi:hypothetical protein
MAGRAVLLAVLAASLVACGSGGAAGKIAAQAKVAEHARSAECGKVGIMLFVGKREDVYGCRMTDVPLAYRPVSQMDSTSIEQCYVYTGGTAYNVTSQIRRLDPGGETFPCVK